MLLEKVKNCRKCDDRNLFSRHTVPILFGIRNLSLFYIPKPLHTDRPILETSSSFGAYPLYIFRRAFRKHSEHISGCSKHVPQNSVHISLTFKTYSEKIRSTFPDAQSPFRKKFGASSPNAPLCSSAFEPHTFGAHPNAVQTKLPRTWCPERDSNPHDLTIRGF